MRFPQGRRWLALVLASVVLPASGCSAATQDSAQPAQPHVLRTATPHITPTPGLTQTRNELAAQIDRRLATHAGHVAVALRDRRTGVEVDAGAMGAMPAASTIKIAIAITVVDKLSRAGEVPEGETAEQLRAMITESDNDAAQHLYDETIDGELPMLCERLGLQTTLGQTAWGLVPLSAHDELLLLDALVQPGKLEERTQDYVLELMSQVDEEQRWGISAGPGAGASIALKNGWLPAGTTTHMPGNPDDESDSCEHWVIHSAGIVTSAEQSYELVIMTRDDPDLASGVALIEDLSRFINGRLAIPVLE